MDAPLTERILERLPSNPPGVALSDVKDYLGPAVEAGLVERAVLSLYRKGHIVRYSGSEGVHLYRLDWAWVRDRSEIQALQSKQLAKERMVKVKEANHDA